MPQGRVGSHDHPASILGLPKPAWAGDDVAMLYDMAHRFLVEEIAPRYDEFEKAEMFDRASWKKAGEAGLLCASMPEEYGGSGGTFAHESAIIEAISHVGVDGFGIAPAQFHRRALHPPLRLRGAEEEVAAEDGDRRTDRRHRHDRARRRLRPAGRQDARREGRQPVSAQRLQDLHHQRPARQSDHRRHQDRSGQGRQGHLADRGRDRRGRGLRARPQPRQDRPEVQRHVGAVLQRRARADVEPARRTRRARASSS